MKSRAKSQATLLRGSALLSPSNGESPTVTRQAIHVGRRSRVSHSQLSMLRGERGAEGRDVALSGVLGDRAAGCPGAGAGAAEVLRRLQLRRERHTARAAVATCEGAACVLVIRTKEVTTNLAGVIRGIAMHALVQVRTDAIRRHLTCWQQGGLGTSLGN